MTSVKFTGEDVARIIANPFNCLRSVDLIFIEDHEPLISESDFIKAGMNQIEQLGAEVYLRHLLANLKGEYVDFQEEEKPRKHAVNRPKNTCFTAVIRTNNKPKK